MPTNIIKTTGPIKSADPSVGGGPKWNYPIFGVVKDNIDATRSGKIKVLLSDGGPLDSDNSANWITVSYLSSFFGKVAASGGQGKDDNGSYTSNPSSYGQWQAPPDIGTTVVCIFINGDPNYGFYIGSVPEAEVLHMVPAIGSSDYIVPNEGEANSYGGATRLPATNMNTNNSSQANDSNFNQSPRPVHSYTASIMHQQGILRDPVRGPISTSASREPVSRVGWGVSSPGRPIYEGGYDDSTLSNNIGDGAEPAKLKIIARRGGHSIVMDDGDIIGKDQLIRIRTALGHQILMSDDGQTLMILHSNGQSYVELGKEGTVDIYSTNSFNVRTQGDINLHADRNINIHAMENLNIQAKNIQTNSEQATKIRSGSDINIAATGKVTGLAGGAIAWGAAGDISLVGGGQAYVNGSKVNLNSGAPSTNPDSLSPIPLVAQTDTLFDKEKGFIASPGKLLTITSRTPAHAPWANAGQGVDIQNSMDADDNLPAAASGAADATNQEADAANPQAPDVATVASAPNSTPAASASLDKNVTAAAVASTATSAAKGALKQATVAGATVVQTDQGTCAAVGPMALTPGQLELGGAIKPGASTMVNALINSGKNISQSMPDSIFTKNTNINSFIKDVPAQANTLVNTFKKAQTALGAVGVLTGKESPTQITGLVMSAATVGVGPTIAAIHQSNLTNINPTSLVTSAAKLTKLTSNIPNISNITDKAKSIAGGVNGITSSLTGSLSGPLNGKISSLAGATTGTLTNAANGAIGNVLNKASSLTNIGGQAQNALKAIGSGSAAAKLTESIGGLGGIQSALTAMGNVPTLSGLVNQSQGIAKSAFNAVKQGLKPFKANIPQNLTQIAKDNASASAMLAETSGSQVSSSLLNKTGGALGGNLLSKVTGTVGEISALARNASGIVNSVASVNNSVAAITGSISAGSNILSTAAGGARAITSTINNVSSVVNTISRNVTGSAINTSIGGVQNAVSAVHSLSGAASALTSGGGLPALSNAAVILQRGASASTSSIFASGLSSLPGNINTVANIVNKASGALNLIPGTGGLSGIIKNATSMIMSGSSTSKGALSALNSLSNLAGSASTKLGGLSSLVSSGLPVGQIAQLTSAISSLTGGVPGSIGLPSVGFNTTKRDSISSAISSVLGNPKIPAPNFVGGVSDEAQETYEAQRKQQFDKSREVTKEFEKQYDKVYALYTAYNKALKKYGPDDPNTIQAREAWFAASSSKEYLDAKKALDSL